MLQLFSEENALEKTREEITKLEKALLEFKKKKPLAEQAVVEKKDFDFGDTLFFMGLKDNKEFEKRICSYHFSGEKYKNSAYEKIIRNFKNTLDNAIPFVEEKINFLKQQLPKLEKQLETARKTLHAEDQRQADLVVYKQGELNKIQIEKLKLEAEHAEQEQERRKARLDQLNSLSNRSENIRRELESDWERRRAKQDSERESIYNFVFDRNDKS